jgi:hypothetical protein
VCAAARGCGGVRDSVWGGGEAPGGGGAAAPPHVDAFDAVRGAGGVVHERNGAHWRLPLDVTCRVLSRVLDWKLK